MEVFVNIIIARNNIQPIEKSIIYYDNMKRNKLLFYAVVVLICAGFISCIDNDYDLSDIDTNVRFSVKDLVIPVNIDVIELDGMLDLKYNSKIKKNGNEYAFMVDGDFSSNSIFVNTITFNSSQLQSSKRIELNKSASETDKPLAYANLKNATAIKTSTAKVDPSIVSVDSFTTDMDIRINLQFNGLTPYIKRLGVKDLKIKLLRGLKDLKTNIGSYDPETGVLDIGDTQTTSDHKLELSLYITKVDAKKIGITNENGTFFLNDSISVISGQIVIYQDQIKGSALPVLPTFVEYTLSVNFGVCTVKSFSGKIKYDITGVNIDPIDLNDIPVLLSQKGTNIILENPQIYLNVNNPLYQNYNLIAKTGLSLKGNETYSTFSNAIVLNHTENSFVLSPYNPQKKYDGFENAQPVLFENLGKVISGEQIPSQVEVKLISPMIPEQRVTNFNLGVSIPPVKGKWLLYAPLNLTTSSTIKYSKTWDNWQDKDLDGLTVEKAQISATITSDVPLTLDVSFTLLGRKGEMSGKASLAADTKDKVIVIPLTGTSVSEIYGLTIDVTTRGGGLISPSQKMIVKNLSAKVTGHYDREL